MNFMSNGFPGIGAKRLGQKTNSPDGTAEVDDSNKDYIYIFTRY
jgi:hypothetical protein